jgi:hypothetical protein
VKRTKLPKGWDEAQVRRVADHYDAQSEDEAVSEDDVALGGEAPTIMKVPAKLVPAVRRLIAKQQAKRRAA